MALSVRQITVADDLAPIVDDINAAAWDAANDVVAYEEAALRAYLEREDTVFVVCYEGDVLMGMASARLQMKPYDRELWFYVDEVDVCVDQRRRGAGQAIMNALIGLAEAQGCDELWLGTEVDNAEANALYRSLEPDDVQRVVGYTFETD